jgi:thiosulfate/3-mercaptopyruvate sulfurtransferase
LRAFGHENVKVLNGSIELWEQLKYPVNTHIPDTPVPCSYNPNYLKELVADIEEVKNAVKNKDYFITDARSAERFSGKSPEPRAGLKQGHIPGSINIPCTTLVDMSTGKLKNNAELKKIVDAAGVDDSKPIISSCGSGVTACVLVLALYELGKTNVKVYDGSWSEWGQKM